MFVLGLSCFIIKHVFNIVLFGLDGLRNNVMPIYGLLMKIWPAENNNLEEDKLQNEF